MEDSKVAAAIESAGQDEPKEAAPLVETAKEAPKEETATVEAVAEPSPAVEESTEKDVESEIDLLLKDEETPVHKDGVQRRIDKLTAEKKALQEELDRAKAERETKSGVEPKYTDEQLKKALRKAMDDGDSDLVWEIQQYQLKQVKKELRDEYTNEQKQRIETAQRAAKEWESVVNRYDYLAAPEEPEFYPGSKKELALKDQTSLLYQVALKLFTNDSKYQMPGGQELAVADALALILKKKRTTLGATGKETLLQRQLAKEKRKSSLGSGESMTQDAPLPSKPKSEAELLDEVINERKKFRAERSFGMM